MLASDGLRSYMGDALPGSEPRLSLLCSMPANELLGLWLMLGVPLGVVRPEPGGGGGGGAYCGGGALRGGTLRSRSVD